MLAACSWVIKLVMRQTCSSCHFLPGLAEAVTGCTARGPGARQDKELGRETLVLPGAEQGKDAKNGLAAPLAAPETRSDSVSLLERGGSTFSVESGDGAPERRRSFQVRRKASRKNGASIAVACMPACLSLALAHK